MLRRLIGRAILLCTLIVIGPAAWAVGPAGQTIAPTDDSVVRVLYNAGLSGGLAAMRGTGSVVGNTQVNGDGYLWILTADHVVADGGPAGSTKPGLGLGFGNSPTGSGTSAYFAGATASPTDIFRGGSTGVVDLALFGVNYGGFDSNLDSLVVDLVAAASLFNFSEVGFGNQGNLVAGGYQAQNIYGTQRYFNQKVINFNPGYSASGYTFDAVEFAIQNPTDAQAPAGSGAALNGDSGSPWFSSDFNGTYFTDNQFAVLAGIQSSTPGGLFPFGAVEYGVALTSAEVNWVYSHIPEPANICWIVLLIGVAHRRRPGK